MGDIIPCVQGGRKNKESVFALDRCDGLFQAPTSVTDVFSWLTARVLLCLHASAAAPVDAVESFLGFTHCVGLCGTRVFHLQTRVCGQIEHRENEGAVLGTDDLNQMFLHILREAAGFSPCEGPCDTDVNPTVLPFQR